MNIRIIRYIITKIFWHKQKLDIEFRQGYINKKHTIFWSIPKYVCFEHHYVYKIIKKRFQCNTIEKKEHATEASVIINS